jgi:Fungal N-terminal domain of STAND proteins
MADPFSISVSILTVLGSGMTVAKTLNSLISGYKTAPAAILALSNEVSDLILLVQEIRDRGLGGETAAKLSIFLDRAESKLKEVQLFVESVGVLGASKPNRMRYEKLSWAAKKSRKADELKRDLHDVKLSIILVLSTATMYQSACQLDLTGMANSCAGQIFNSHLRMRVASNEHIQVSPR